MKRTDIDYGFKDNRGKGPKNWQRSDEKIYDEICDRLTSHLQVDASDINVRVENGIVTLEGWVNSRQEKWAADRLTEEVLGVKEVQNEIHLRNRLIKSG